MLLAVSNKFVLVHFMTESYSFSLYSVVQIQMYHPVSILYKSIAGRYRPVRVADGPITARYRFIKNAGWALRTER